MDGPDEWIEYELGALMSIREELLDGDLRALYIVWLAAQREMGSNGEDSSSVPPPVPPGFQALTGAQQALAELLLVSQEMLYAAARHSADGAPTAPGGDAADLVELLPSDRQIAYLKRLARNEPGLGRLLIHELRALHPDTSAATSSAERVAYATLLAESQAIRRQLDREQQEREERARQRRMQQIHDHQDEQWTRISQAVDRGSGTGYDEATRLLVELREVADQFREMQAFQEHFRSWVKPHLRRPAFTRRLLERHFLLPEA